MKDEIMSPVSEQQAKDSRSQVTSRDGGVDDKLFLAFHGEDFGDKVNFNREDRHGDGVVEHDDATFTLCLNQVHVEQINDNVFHTPLNHRA